jgi:hypothetical protein
VQYCLKVTKVTIQFVDLLRGLMGHESLIEQQCQIMQALTKLLVHNSRSNTCDGLILEHFLLSSPLLLHLSRRLE